MVFRSYLPYQTTLRLQERESRFVLHIVGVKWRCQYEETSKQEVNDVQSDARLLSDDILRELF